MNKKLLYVFLAIFAMTAMLLSGCSTVSDDANNQSNNGANVTPYSSATPGAYNTVQPSATAAAVTDNGAETLFWVLLVVAVIGVVIWLARRGRSTSSDRTDNY